MIQIIGIRTARNGVSVPAYLSGLRARRAELESQVVEILKRGVARGTTSHEDRQTVIALQKEISDIKKTLAAFAA